MASGKVGQFSVKHSNISGISALGEHASVHAIRDLSVIYIGN